MYLDTIIVLATTEQEAMERLERVLKKAEEYGLRINFKNCSFLKRKVEILGNVVEELSIYPSPDKIKAVANYPQHRNVKDVQCFLGLASYFRKRSETEVHTDASKEGFGAVLFWDEDGKFHPVYYMSKKTMPNQKNDSSYELEVLVVVEALKKFSVYLLGQHFKIATDCNAFTKKI